MFKYLWGSGGSQEEQNRPQMDWSSRPSTSANFNNQLYLQQQSNSRIPLPNTQCSPADSANIRDLLNAKSLDEIKKLQSDKDAYIQFLLSLEEVKLQNNVYDELQKETLQIARENLEKEPRILELKDQCTIIRTTDLAAALEKLSRLERQKEESIRGFSPSVLLQELQEAMDRAEDETENLQRQLIGKEIEPAMFLQECKKLRTTYQRRALIHLAAQTPFPG
ncbi:hypothetical protein MKW94_021325 [Papaver nudicaule]|uniref:VPS37 C-terminal domain-containing protein n=1 Tax=Papaver nudicaule TaxID=74823 RepID=A0AA41VLY3_PAPNU|nr:hypothetical protein [Papaver nudicaule]